MTLSRLRWVYQTFLDHQVLWHEGRLVIEQNGVTSYHYEGDYPPTEPPTMEAVRTELALPAGENDTLAIGRNFVQAILDDRPEGVRSSFGDGMSSLAAVLAANVSDRQGGKRMFSNSPNF